MPEIHYRGMHALDAPCASPHVERHARFRYTMLDRGREAQQACKHAASTRHTCTRPTREAAPLLLPFLPCASSKDIDTPY